MTGCNKCGSENLEVNGIFYVCNECGDVDDSTFSMIMKRAIKSPPANPDLVCAEKATIEKTDVFFSDKREV